MKIPAPRATIAVVGVRATAAVIAVAVAQWPAVASAANGAVPRTPPVFVDPQCLTVVDRTVDPVFQLDFSIPFEDVELTPDEPSDARTFQFFAVCRDFSAAEALPPWISADDVMRSIASGAIEQAPSPAQVLEGNAAWSSGHDGAPDTCVLPVNGANDRIPITCAATDGGAAWDTSAAPAGNYLIWGYTFQPSVNLWTPRPGVVRVVDGDDASLPPVVSLMSPWGEPQVYADDGFRIVGCMAGVPGTVVRVEWTAINQDLDDPAAWAPVADDLDAASGTFDLLFLPPPEAVNQAVVVRATATDPQGRTWVAHARGAMIVLPGDGCSASAELQPGPDFCGVHPGPAESDTGDAPACADGGASGSDGADTTSGASDSTTGGIHPTGSGDSAGDTTEAAVTPEAGACACRAREIGPFGAAWWWLGVVVLARRRRRTAGWPHLGRSGRGGPPRAGTTGESRATLQAV